jgi:hypothetical protein
LISVQWEMVHPTILSTLMTSSLTKPKIIQS